MTRRAPSDLGPSLRRLARRALFGAPLLTVAFVGLTAAGQEAPSSRGRVFLSEIVPALSDTPIGAIDLGAAPAPGATRVVRRAEVLAALAHEGRSADGLAIPATTRIVRRAQVVAPDSLVSLATSELASTLAPCTVTQAVARSSATVGEGELTIHAHGPTRPSSGAVLVTLDVEAGGVVTHVPVQADVSCPAPVVAPGREVEVRVVRGAVTATARGVVRQSGRVGDVVRVEVSATHRTIDARVLDADAVEVVR